MYQYLLAWRFARPLKLIGQKNVRRMLISRRYRLNVGKFQQFGLKYFIVITQPMNV